MLERYTLGMHKKKNRLYMRIEDLRNPFESDDDIAYGKLSKKPVRNDGIYCFKVRNTDQYLSVSKEVRALYEIHMANTKDYESENMIYDGNLPKALIKAGLVIPEETTLTKKGYLLLSAIKEAEEVKEVSGFLGDFKTFDRDFLFETRKEINGKLYRTTIEDDRLYYIDLGKEGLMTGYLVQNQEEDDGQMACHDSISFDMYPSAETIAIMLAGHPEKTSALDDEEYRQLAGDLIGKNLQPVYDSMVSEEKRRIEDGVASRSKVKGKKGLDPKKTDERLQDLYRDSMKFFSDEEDQIYLPIIKISDGDTVHSFKEGYEREEIISMIEDVFLEDFTVEQDGQMKVIKPRGYKDIIDSIQAAYDKKSLEESLAIKSEEGYRHRLKVDDGSLSIEYADGRFSRIGTLSRYDDAVESYSLTPSAETISAMIAGIENKKKLGTKKLRGLLKEASDIADGSKSITDDLYTQLFTRKDEALDTPYIIGNEDSRKVRLSGDAKDMPELIERLFLESITVKDEKGNERLRIMPDTGIFEDLNSVVRDALENKDVKKEKTQRHEKNNGRKMRREMKDRFRKK